MAHHSRRLVTLSFVRLTVVVCLGVLALLTGALMFGARTQADMLGYARRAPDHFDLFIHDTASGLTLNLTRTPLLDEANWDAAGGWVVVELSLIHI
jgi:hypothetical protein